MTVLTDICIITSAFIWYSNGFKTSQAVFWFLVLYLIFGAVFAAQLENGDQA